MHSLSQAHKTVLKGLVVSDHFVRAGSDAEYTGYTSEQLQQRVDRRKKSRPLFTNSNNSGVMWTPKRQAINHFLIFLLK